MTRVTVLAALACLTFAATFATADDAATATCDAGLCKGDSIAPFYVTKIAGAEDDGVDVGEALCYRCRYGSSPMVMVFARGTGEKMTELVKSLDSAVAKHQDSKLKGLVTVYGGEADTLKEAATTLASASASKMVPIVVPSKAGENFAAYKLTEGADVTIVIASGGQVTARHNFAADSIDIAAVMGEVEEMLN